MSLSVCQQCVERTGSFRLTWRSAQDLCWCSLPLETDVRIVRVRSALQDDIGTYLSPGHLCQGADELRCRVYAELDGLFVDNLANREPQCGFEALQRALAVFWDTPGFCTSSRAVFSSSAMVVRLLLRMLEVLFQEKTMTVEGEVDTAGCTFPKRVRYQHHAICL